MIINILTNYLLNLSQFTIICIKSGIDPNINEFFHSQKGYEFLLRLSSITIILVERKVDSFLKKEGNLLSELLKMVQLNCIEW